MGRPHRGIIVYIINLEYNNVCPLVQIGSAHLLSRKRVYPPRNQRGVGWGCNTCLWVRGYDSDDLRERLALCLLCGRPSVLFYSIYCSQQKNQSIKNIQRWPNILLLPYFAHASVHVHNRMFSDVFSCFLSTINIPVLLFRKINLVSCFIYFKCRKGAPWNSFYSKTTWRQN